MGSIRGEFVFITRTLWYNAFIYTGTFKFVEMYYDEREILEYISSVQSRILIREWKKSLFRFYFYG